AVLQRGRARQRAAPGGRAPVDVRGRHARAPDLDAERAQAPQARPRDRARSAEPVHRRDEARRARAARGSARAAQATACGAGGAQCLHGSGAQHCCGGAERVSAIARWLPALAVASAMLAIANGTWALDHKALLFVFKPLTTLLIIAHAWQRGADTPAARRFVLAGLWFSLVGDIALLWPQQG